MSQEGLFPESEPVGGSEAVISDDSAYRYWLSRRWADDGDGATFIMLNPSTADATVDDPTIRRCIGFAKAWGCSLLRVVNLYALRSTDPAGLWTHDDPVGPENDHWIRRALAVTGGPVVAAWGANAKPERVDEVLALPGADQLHALGFTKAGQPRHPLYLPAHSMLRPLIEGKTS